MPPSAILRGLKYRRGLELESRLDFAQTLMRVAMVAISGGTFQDVIEHLAPPDFVRDTQKTKSETKSANISLETLNRFRNVEKKWDEKHGSR